MLPYLEYIIFVSYLWAIAYHREYESSILNKTVIPFSKWLSKEDNALEIRFKREAIEVDYSSGQAFFKSFAKRLSLFVEMWVLGRISFFGYWNNVNMNLRLVGILLISTFSTFPFLYGKYVLKIGWITWPIIFTILGGVFTNFFWQERSSYYQKWKYLADLYNDVLKASPQIAIPEDSEFDYHSYRESLNIALAIDIIQMEMWSHDSYKDIVAAELKNAMDEKENLSEENFYSDVRKLTKEDAVTILSTYQKSMFTREEAKFRRTLAKKYAFKKAGNI